MGKVFLALLFCMSMGMTTVQAQDGIDPDAQMLFDFENGDVSNWSMVCYGRGEKGSIELADAENGDPVRFGRYALKVNFDMTDADDNQTLNINISPGLNAFTIPARPNSGRKFGMWIYATPEAAGFWIRPQMVTSAGSAVTVFGGEPTIDWVGWKYIEMSFPGGDNMALGPQQATTALGFIRLIALNSRVKTNSYIIIDDVRVSHIPEDLTPPTITGITGNGTDLNGQTFTTGHIDIVGAFHDNHAGSSGINFDNVRLIIDGFPFQQGDPGFTVNVFTNRATLTGMNFSNGLHTCELYVEDNFGHIRTSTATFTVDAAEATTTVSVVTSDEVRVGSVYEIKLNTNNASDVQGIDFTIQLSNVASIDETNGVAFAASASESSYSFNPRLGHLKINLKNNSDAAAAATLATIKVNISEFSSASDVLRCTPVSAKVTYADNSFSTFTFTPVTLKVEADYDFAVVKRIVGMPGEILVTDLDGNPQAGVTVRVLNTQMVSLESAETGTNGIATGLVEFTKAAQGVYIVAGKDDKFSFTRLVPTLNPLMTNAPTYIRAGTTVDPTTTKTFTWMANPLTAAEPSILKLAKKDEGESSFTQIAGETKIIEYDGASRGALKGSAITLENLEPATTYIYQVGDGVTWSDTREFTTTSTIDKFSFSAFGDLQATSNGDMNRFIAAASTIEALPEKPFFNLNVGDIVDTNDRYDYFSYFGYLFNQRPMFAGIDMVAAYGNHEYMGGFDAGNIKFSNGHPRVAPSVNYDAQLVGTGSYAVEYGNMLVIAIDWAGRPPYASTPQVYHQEQAKWLREILSKTDKTWKVITIHYPIFPPADHPTSRTILQPVIDEFNVQMVFCGHGHTFERVQVKDGVIISPDGNRRTFTPVIGGSLHLQLGDMLVTNANGRWVFCEVDGGKMTFTVRDGSNNVVENECFTLYAGMADYEVSFDTENENGTLVATVDDAPFNTGDQVEIGKSVVFTATPNENFRVKGWKLNGVAVPGNTTNTYTLKNVSKTSEVTVEFIEIKYHTVVFDVVNGNGTIAATVGGASIETDEDALFGMDIVFTATPAAGYQVKEWKQDGVVITGNKTKTYTLIFLSKNAEVTVEFEKINYTVAFSAGDNGALVATVDDEAITSPAQVDHGMEVVFTATPGEHYLVKEWKLNGSVVADNKTDTYTLTVSAAATVTVEFEKMTYTVVFEVVNDENGALAATVDDEEITSGAKLTYGAEVVFTATPDENYRVKEWTLNGDVIAGNKTDTYTLIVTDEAEVTVSFEMTTYEVTFSVASGNGTLVATVDDEEIATGAQVERGKDVVFTATPASGNRIKEWKLDGAAIEGVTTHTTYTLENLTEPAEVTVAFESITGVDENLTANPLKAWTRDGLLHVSGLTPGEVWSVYGVSGALVYQNVAMSNEATIPIRDHGVYMVHSGNYVIRVVFN